MSADLEALAQLVRTALEAGDLESYAQYLDPDVRWGSPGDPQPSCRNRNQALAWYRRGWEEGTRAEVSEIVIGEDRLLVGLLVRGRETAADGSGRPEEAERWQVLTVRGGLVTEIVGFEEREEAEAWMVG